MITKKYQTGSALVVIIVLAAVAIVGGLGFVYWQNLANKKSSEPNSQTSSKNDDSRKVTVHPQDSQGMKAADSFTTSLPKGWSVQKVYEDEDIVKTTSDGNQYLISSFVVDPDSTPAMENNQVSMGEIVKTVKTSKGTSVSVVKTPNSLTLTTCMPTGNDCYLQLNGKSLFVHLYWYKPGAQAAVDMDYTSASVQEIISDFESIAASLNI